MKNNAIVTVIFVVAAVFAGVQAHAIQGMIAILILTAGVTTALLFSVGRHGRERTLGDGEEGLGMEGPSEHSSRFQRLSTEDREAIANIVFDQLLLWASRSIVRKLWLAVLAFGFAAGAWLVKDHIK